MIIDFDKLVHASSIYGPGKDEVLEIELEEPRHELVAAVGEVIFCFANGNNLYLCQGRVVKYEDEPKGIPKPFSRVNIKGRMISFSLT